MLFRSSKRFELLLQFIDLLELEADIGVLPISRAEELIRFSGDELAKMAPHLNDDIIKLVDLTVEGLAR